VNGEADESDKADKSDHAHRSAMPSESEPAPISAAPGENDTKGGKQSTDWQRRHYRVQVATVIVGLIVAFIYGCQLNEMRKSTEAATKMAKVAKDSLIFAQDNTHLEQRPWVTVISVLSQPRFPEAGKPLTIRIVLKNTGKTPAKYTVSHIIIEPIATSESDFSFDKDEQSDRQQGLQGVHSEALIAPDSMYEATTTIGAGTIDKSQVEKLNADLIRIFVFGRITYVDVLGCEHWTTFCYKLSTIGDYNAYKTFNETDDNRCP
jgi:hypothetical protein